MERIVKPAFAVVGMEGATTDGPGFVQTLWAKANGRFAEVAHLAKQNADGTLAGVWGVMSDLSRSFRPWEDGFTRGLYLAGVEAQDNAVPPEGWTRWDVPGFEYIRVLCDAPDVFPRTLEAIAAEGFSLAGAVHDFTDPATGASYMLFPIRRL